MNRTERQTEIIRNWFASNRVGTVEAATGFGKTRIALRILRKLQKDVENASALIIVPTLYLQDQWNERLENYNINIAEVVVINGLIKSYNEDNITHSVDLLVLDEIHRYVAPEFVKVYECVKYKDVLGLSATIPQDDRYSIISERAPIIDSVHIKDALDNNWVAPYTIYNVPIFMTDEEENRYHELTSSFYKFFAHFNHDLDLVFKCLRSNQACINYAKRLNRSPGFIKGQAANVSRNMQKRKSFLYNLESKAKVAEEIINKCSDKNIICFGQTTRFADKIEALFPNRCRAYHSSVSGKDIDGEYFGKDRYKDWILEQFSDEESDITVLSTARAMDEGADIPSIEVGILCAYSSKALQFIQRIGRVIRKEKNKQAIIIVLYTVDTQEEKWLNKMQKSLSNASIENVFSINEIPV
jgi:superfamily II DNA or RNA helicase